MICTRFLSRPATSRTPRNSLPRSTATQWQGLMDAVRKFRIVVDFGVLRLIRSAVMHETLALRLHPDIDILKEYRRFLRAPAG